MALLIVRDQTLFQFQFSVWRRKKERNWTTVILTARKKEQGGEHGSFSSFRYIFSRAQEEASASDRWVARVLAKTVDMQHNTWKAVRFLSIKEECVRSTSRSGLAWKWGLAKRHVTRFHSRFLYPSILHITDSWSLVHPMSHMTLDAPTISCRKCAKWNVLMISEIASPLLFANERTRTALRTPPSNNAGQPIIQPFLVRFPPLIQQLIQLYLSRSPILTLLARFPPPPPRLKSTANRPLSQSLHPLSLPHPHMSRVAQWMRNCLDCRLSSSSCW